MYLGISQNDSSNIIDSLGTARFARLDTTTVKPGFAYLITEMWHVQRMSAS